MKLRMIILFYFILLMRNVLVRCRSFDKVVTHLFFVSCISGIAN